MKEDLMIQQLSKCSGNKHILKRDEEEKIQSLKNISLFSRTKEELKKKSKTKIEDIFNKNTYNITNVNILNNDNIQYPSFNTLNNNIKTCKINNTIIDKLKKKEEQRKCSNILNSIVQKKSIDSSSSYFSEEFSKNKYKNYLLNKSSVYLKSKCHKESNINLNLKKLERLQKKMKNINNISYVKKGNIESSDEHEQSGSDNYDDNISDDNRSDNNISDDNISDDNISDDNISDNNICDDNISDDNRSDDNISDDNRIDDNISDDNISDNNICDDNISDDNISGDNNINGDNNISDDNKNDDDNIRDDNYINYEEYNNNMSDDKNSLSKYVYEKRFKLNLLKDGSNENIYSIVSKRKYNNTYKKKCLYLGTNKLNNICKENLKIKRSYLRYCGENESSGNRKLSNGMSQLMKLKYLINKKNNEKNKNSLFYDSNDNNKFIKFLMSEIKIETKLYKLILFLLFLLLLSLSKNISDYMVITRKCYNIYENPIKSIYRIIKYIIVLFKICYKVTLPIFIYLLSCLFITIFRIFVILNIPIFFFILYIKFVLISDKSIITLYFLFFQFFYKYLVFHCEDIFKNLKSHISLDNFLTLIYKTSSFIFYYMVRVFQTFQNHINPQFYELSDSNSK
ncbi:conserved Plasmodium membrane protein, unknown function [Plasmodium sp. DRC-Itaito]|nr:conserved Plasmodium membrane protein, unknown function [Plasmodium sp. DRC-Itaito]